MNLAFLIKKTQRIGWWDSWLTLGEFPGFGKNVPTKRGLHFFLGPQQILHGLTVSSFFLGGGGGRNMPVMFHLVQGNPSCPPQSYPPQEIRPY